MGLWSRGITVKFQGMRIIAGSRARMRLLAPGDMKTRPITDRAKESLFSILGSRVSGARVADLFCGTGSLGLEALSRGAGWALMVDRDRDAVARLGDNIKRLRFEEQTCVVCWDLWRRGMPRRRPGWEVEAYDVIFVDPPYSDSQKGGEESKLAHLLAAAAQELAEGGMVVLRHEKRAEVLSAYGDLSRTDRREYGNMAIDFMMKGSGRAAEEA